MIQFVAILTAIKEILTLGFKVYGLIKEAKLKGWIDEGKLLTKQITEAKTDEERAALARRLFLHSDK